MFSKGLSECQWMGPDWPSMPSDRLRVDAPAETPSELISRGRYTGLSLAVVLSALSLYSIWN